MSLTLLYIGLVGSHVDLASHMVLAILKIHYCPNITFSYEQLL